MNIKKMVSIFSLLSTIIQGIVAAVSSLIAIVSIVVMIILAGFINESAGLMDQPDPDSVIAGWAILFGLAGTVFGIIVIVVIAIVLLHFLAPAIVNTLLTVEGVRTYKNRENSTFKKMVRKDSIHKLINNIISTAYIVIVISLVVVTNLKESEEITGLFTGAMSCCVPFILSGILNIINLVLIKNIEEEPEKYISYYEDNSPYLWQ